MPSKPKSFIDLLKPKRKTAPPAPIIHAPMASLTPEQLATEQVARKANIILLDNVRCPICIGQLDGHIGSTRISLECVYDPGHYACAYFDTRPDLLTFAEAVKQGKPNVQTLYLYSDADGYQVMCDVQENGLYNCRVFKLDLSFPEPVRNRNKQLVATFAADVDRSWCASYEVFAKKVELLQLFS